MINNIPLYFLLGKIKLLLDVLPPHSNQYVMSVALAFQCSITNLCAPPFVYRYLLVCHNMKATNKNVFLIYFVFLLPVLLNIPLRIYLCLKYEPMLLALVPPDLDVCPGEEYITGYRTAHVQGKVDLGFLGNQIKLYDFLKNGIKAYDFLKK